MTTKLETMNWSLTQKHMHNLTSFDDQALAWDRLVLLSKLNKGKQLAGYRGENNDKAVG